MKFPFFKILFSWILFQKIFPIFHPKSLFFFINFFLNFFKHFYKNSIISVGATKVGYHNRFLFFLSPKPPPPQTQTLVVKGIDRFQVYQCWTRLSNRLLIFKYPSEYYNLPGWPDLLTGWLSIFKQYTPKINWNKKF